MRRPHKLIKVSESLDRTALYRTEGGLTVTYYGWLSDKSQRWTAIWTDTFSVKHRICGSTFAELNHNLACYGMRIIR